MTNPNCVCNDLTNFESESQAMTGNESYVNMMELAVKTREITSIELISGGF